MFIVLAALQRGPQPAAGAWGAAITALHPGFSFSRWFTKTASSVSPPHPPFQHLAQDGRV